MKIGKFELKSYDGCNILKFSEGRQPSWALGYHTNSIAVMEPPYKFDSRKKSTAMTNLSAKPIQPPYKFKNHTHLLSNLTISNNLCQFTQIKLSQCYGMHWTYLCAAFARYTSPWKRWLHALMDLLTYTMNSIKYGSFAFLLAYVTYFSITGRFSMCMKFMVSSKATIL